MLKLCFNFLTDLQLDEKNTTFGFTVLRQFELRVGTKVFYV